VASTIDLYYSAGRNDEAQGWRVGRSAGARRSRRDGGIIHPRKGGRFFMSGKTPHQ
jgi:hypothetical protein